MGSALFLGAVLIVAGVLKVASPAAFRHAVYRLLPEAWKRRRRMALVSARLVGMTEIVVGGGLLSAPWTGRPASVVSSVAAAALYVSFVAVVGIAARRGRSCGCFGSFSDGTAGGAEIARAVLLAAIATGVAVASAYSSGSRSWSWASLAWASACAAVLIVWVSAAGRVLPARRGDRPSRASASAILRQALGQVTSELGDAELPLEKRLSPEETRAVVSTTLASPSYRAFIEWLEARALRVDWTGAVARSTSGPTAAGEPLEMVELAPRATEAVRLSVLVGVAGVPKGDVLVFAVVDGGTVVASAGVVRPADSRSISVGQSAPV